MNQLRLITYNIHKGFSARNARFVLEPMKKALEKINCDVVLLQEVRGAHDQNHLQKNGWSNEAQFEYLADTLWPHYAYGKNALYQSGHHGNAILSRYPFDSWENINLSTLRYYSRSILHGVIEVPGTQSPLHLMCLHLGLREANRKKSIIRLEERIREHVPEEAPLIIGGDFNDWRGKLSRSLEDDLGVQEIHWSNHRRHLKTFPSKRPLLPLDRVYYRGLRPTRAKVLRGKPWNELSDHLPIYVEFEMV